MILGLYITISYLVMLGMMLETYPTTNEIPSEAWVYWIFSPIILPIIIGGIQITNKNK